MNHILSLVYVLGLLSAATADSFALKTMIYGGTGCPSTGSAPSIKFSNSDQIQITYPAELHAAVGKDLPPADARNNCQVTLELEYSTSGWQYALSEAYFQGQSKLEAGLDGTVKTIAYFSSELDETDSSFDLHGPIDSKFYGYRAFNGTVWSKCTKVNSLNINHQYRIAGDDAKSGKVDAAGLIQYFYMKWRRC